jgi:predicted GNAT superfamily acetyltransferase
MRTDDLDWVLAMNNAAAPHVGELDAGKLAALFSDARMARVAEAAGRPAGAVICFSPGAPYASENYRWFQARYDDFLYIDRIFVDGPAAGAGIGRSFYADLEGFAASRFAMLACEVNERPPNPVSMLFHEALGFGSVGRQTTEGGAKTVVMMTKSLSLSP